jgi:hypothetical protein
LKSEKAIFVFIFFFLSVNLFCSATPHEIEDIVIGRHLIVDESRHLYTNISSTQLIKYSSKGVEQFKIGRKGEGPGDIKRLGWFELNPVDSLLYVTEFIRGNKRVSLFSSEDGHFVRLWESEFDWNTWDYISFIQFDSKGNVYVNAVKLHWRRHKDFRIGSFCNAIIKFDKNGKKMYEIYRMQFDYMGDKGGKGNVTIPFTGGLRWCVSGDQIFIREAQKPQIEVFSLNGKHLRKISLPFSVRKVSEKDIARWEKRLKEDRVIGQGIREGWFDLKYWRRNLPFPTEKPISSGLMIAGPNGVLYSKKATEEEEEDKNIWAMFAMGSGKVSICEFPTNHRLRTIKNNAFYFTVLDEDDVLTLKILDSKQVCK